MALGVAYGAELSMQQSKKKQYKTKSVPKARIHQADNLAKLRQEFLSMLELIAQILCAVVKQKSSEA